MVICKIAMAQQTSCALNVHGNVTLSASGLPASSATIYIPRLQKKTLADSAGKFYIENICHGGLQLKITYEGYKTIDTIIQIENHNMVLSFSLSNAAKELKAVNIVGEVIRKDQITTAVKTTLSGQALDQTRGLSLGESLKGITGVNTIQNGPSISKPVIHGLYSNRILIMNNGVRQEGQQWGNDHAPEIDPFIATKVTVIKGAASIRYGSDAIGGVVSVEPKDMPKELGADGDINIVGLANGQVGVASGMIEDALATNKLKGLSWRLQGTVKQAGNAMAPHYDIGNTAFKEDDYSATVNYEKPHFGGQLYYSRFDTKIGIADASVIGSGQDFLSIPAEPSVKAGFTYNVKRPYQSVNHQLVKANGFINLSPNMGKIEAVYAFQNDIRKEYDASPSTNSNTSNTDKIPDLNLRLNTSTLDLIWEYPPIKNKIKGSIGFNFIRHGNLEQGTSYLQLIPNFVDYGGGIFAIEKWEIKKLIVEGGLRYDYRWLQAYMDNPANLVEEEPIHKWQNATVNLGATYRFSNQFSGTLNFGSAWRPPTVLELYADGVHQSAAAWERGDSMLSLERAYNTSIAFRYTSTNFNAEIGTYVNYFKNYIYAKPDSLPAYTITGQYPAFDYTGVKNALFKGLDLSFTYTFLKRFSLTSKTTIIRARNLDLKQWLINVPADRFDNSIKYTIPFLGKIKGFYLNVSNLVVSRQVRVSPLLTVPSGEVLTKPEQVYNKLINPPAGYMLWGADAGCSMPLGHQYIEVSFSVTNLTNTVYRDYLDEFRYYVDALGRNFILRIKIPFAFKKKAYGADINTNSN